MQSKFKSMSLPQIISFGAEEGRIQPHVLMEIVEIEEMSQMKCKSFYVTDAEAVNWFAMYLITTLR